MAVFSIIIIIIVVVTAVGIIWPEVPDHGLGDRGLIFVRNFLSSQWALGAPSLMSGRYWPCMCLHQQWTPSCMEVVTLLHLFFFFHRHYNPLWALACRTISVHFFLSATNSLLSLQALEDLFSPSSLLLNVYTGSLHSGIRRLGSGADHSPLQVYRN